MTMDSIEKLNTAIATIEEARGVPLSASCVVHRGEMLEILEAAQELLPKDLFTAEAIIGEKERIIEEARILEEERKKKLMKMIKANDLEINVAARTPE